MSDHSGRFRVVVELALMPCQNVSDVLVCSVSQHLKQLLPVLHLFSLDVGELQMVALFACVLSFAGRV
jgi:hypothetical protein